MRTLLTGWGRTKATGAELVRATHEDEVAALVSNAPRRGVIARGLGRSYGDAAQNAGGRVLDTTHLSGIDSFDPSTGLLVAGAGLSLDALLRVTVPAGWFPHVTPGTRHVTLGGAVAADVHGKNHHVDGAFAEGVEWLELATPAGVFRAARDHEPELFWATMGGMGLTGVVTRVGLRLDPIPSSRVVVDTVRVDDLDALMERMARDDRPFSVAWVDGSPHRRGRGVLTTGRWATPQDLATPDRRDPHAYEPRTLVAIPPVPVRLANRASIRAFNALWFRKAPARARRTVVTIPAYFHPLDAIAEWNRAYGPRGFIQYQFVVPESGADLVDRAIGLLADRRLPSFLGVLKRFGPANQGPLSFPMDGWTLALDLPLLDGIESALGELDHRVVEAGGRVYLAKDARLEPALVPAMYASLAKWREVRDRVDPEGCLTSDLDRRLDLTGRRGGGR